MRRTPRRARELEMELFGKPLRAGRRRVDAGRGFVDLEIERTPFGHIVRGTVRGRPGRVEVLRLPAPPALLMNNWQSWGPMMKVPATARFPELEKIYRDYSPHVFSPVPDVLLRGPESSYFTAWEGTLLGFLTSRIAHPFFAIEGGDLVGRLEYFDATFDRDVPFEPLVILRGGPVEGLLEAYGRLLRAENRIRVPRRNPVGWCSWYHYFGRLTWDDVLANLDFARCDPDLPFEVFQVDDGFETEIGDWLTPRAGYPALEGLAGAIRERGFIPGIWTAPFSAAETSELFGRHPDWMVAGPDGAAPAYRGWGRAIHALDTTRADVKAWLFDLFSALKRAGFAYFKIDFLFAAAMPGRRSRAATPIEAYREGLEVIRRAAGRDFVLGCGAPLLPSAGYVDGMRIGEDTAPFWKKKTSPFAGPDAFYALRNALFRQFLHRKLWLNDPDCLILRSREVELGRGEREAYALAAGALDNMILDSDDLALIDADGRAVLRRALALRGRKTVVRGLWEDEDVFEIRTAGPRGRPLLEINLSDAKKAAAGTEVEPRSAAFPRPTPP